MGASPEVYRRRRAVALGLAALSIVLAVLAIRSCGDDDELAITAGELRRAALDANPIELTLSFSGDLLIHTPVFARAEALAGESGSYDFALLFAEIRRYVADADLAFCHVETPMTPEPPASYPIFNTPPDLAEGLAKTGWDACSTASNHTLDQGPEGVGETLAALEGAGIEHTGSAASPRQRGEPLIMERDGVKIGYLAYTSDTNGIPVPEQHLVNLFDPEVIEADAKAAREAGADAVIVNLHWASEAAPEYVTEPSREQQELAREVSNLPEVSAVVGQGPHIPQPIERMNGKIVVFSEGNLISNQGADTGLAAGSQDGYIALLDLRTDGSGTEVTGASYVPTWTDHRDYRVLPVGPALEAGEADAAALRASYRRTVSVVGRSPAEPEPNRLP
jgi:hypothetical protein